MSIRNHFDEFCSHWVEVSERVVTKQDGLFRSGFKIREGSFGVDNEGAIDSRTQPMSMCMPEVRPALVRHAKLICVRLPVPQRTLSYVCGSVRPIRQHLLNPMPASCNHTYSCYLGPMKLDSVWKFPKPSSPLWETCKYLFTNIILRPHESVRRDSKTSISHHSKKWFSSTDL